MSNPPDVQSAEGSRPPDIAPQVEAGQKEYRKPKKFDWFTIGLWVLSGVGTASIILREINYGVMLSEDSPTYISVARNLLEGEGLINLYGDFYTTSPPLFPLVIAALGLVGIDVVTAAAYVNAVAFGLTVLTATMWLRSRIESRLLVLWGGCAVVLSVLVAESAAAAMTDALFILFVVLSLVALDWFLETRKWSTLVLAAVWTALACSTRYIGVAVLVAAWLILLTLREISFRQRSKYITVYSIIGIAPLGLWILRNYLAVGSAAGVISSEQFSLTKWSPLTGLDRAGTIFIKWAYSDMGFEYLDEFSKEIWDITILQNPATLAILIKASTLSIVVIFAGYGILRLLGRGSLHSRKTMALLGAFIFFHTLGLVIMLPITDIELSDRFLAPMHVPVIVIFALILNEFLRSISSQWLAKTFLGILCLWLIFQTAATYNNIQDWIDMGGPKGNRYSYTSEYHADSEVIDYISSNSLIGHIYSTDSDRIYLFMNPTHSMSYAGIPDREDPSWHRRHHRQMWTKDDSADAYIVMFYDRMYLYGHEVGDIAELPGMEVVAILEDGAILKRARGTDSGSERTFVDTLLEDFRSVDRSDFDLYINENENRLIYIRDECDSEDTSAPFFLHIYPTDRADLYTFDNLDFDYSEYGFEVSERCIVLRNLPDYDIAEIRTGQWVEGQGHLWKVEVSY